jgi:hypothetical protein
MLVPFEVAGNMFHRLFVLVDGIYPPYSRVVKGIQLPLTDAEKRNTAWQEASRKDIERAFGVLQSGFQVMVRPFLGHSLKTTSNNSPPTTIARAALSPSFVDVSAGERTIPNEVEVMATEQEGIDKNSEETAPAPPAEV